VVGHSGVDRTEHDLGLDPPEVRRVRLGVTDVPRPQVEAVRCEQLVTGRCRARRCDRLAGVVAVSLQVPVEGQFAVAATTWVTQDRHEYRTPEDRLGVRAVDGALDPDAERHVDLDRIAGTPRAAQGEVGAGCRVDGLRNSVDRYVEALLHPARNPELDVEGSAAV